MERNVQVGATETEHKITASDKVICSIMLNLHTESLVPVISNNISDNYGLKSITPLL